MGRSTHRVPENMSGVRGECPPTSYVQLDSSPTQRRSEAKMASVLSQFSSRNTAWWVVLHSRGIKETERHFSEGEKIIKRGQGGQRKPLTAMSDDNLNFY